MALEIDVSRRFQTPDQQRSLVQAVHGAEAEDEAKWVEWKGSLDLSLREHKFKVAKTLLGFANRLPEQAEAWAEGYAYLLIGVEPGNLKGMSRIDIAEVEGKIRPWVGGGVRAPRWRAIWVDVSGKAVLLIEVEPPEPGDPLFPLRMPFEKTQEGTVFVRRQASSNPADAQEILDLSDRAARRRRLSLGVEVGPPVTWTAVVLDPDAIDAALQLLRRSAIESLHQYRRQGRGEILGPFGESRSEREYEEAVNTYVAHCRHVLTDVFISKLIESEVLQMSLRLVNATDHHLSAVQVRAQVAGPVHVWQEDRPTALPQPPQPYGKIPQSTFDVTLLSSNLNTDMSHLLGPDGIQTETGVEIRWQPVELPPQDALDLPGVALAVCPAPESDRLRLEWRASSPSTTGVAIGTVEVEVGSWRPTGSQMLQLIREVDSQ